MDVTGLLDTITEKRMTEAIRERGDAKFAEVNIQLSEIRFANLVVDAGTVHSLKTIVCLLANPHHPIRPVLLALRENTNFTADDYATPFVELFHQLNSIRLGFVQLSSTICELNPLVLVESSASQSFCR
jgi:hypothetical protein